MPGTFYSDSYPYRARKWVEDHQISLIKPIKSASWLFILGIASLYLVYLLSFIACSILMRLGIIESGLCSLVLL
jgi:hypothetical protein